MRVSTPQSATLRRRKCVETGEVALGGMASACENTLVRGHSLKTGIIISGSGLDVVYYCHPDFLNNIVEKRV